MKLEAITPFLGKYRPFVGRCCQTCTPKSWVSDVELGPTLGSLGQLGCGSHGSGEQLPGSALPAHASALVFRGVRQWGWLAALGELDGKCRGAWEEAGVWPRLHSPAVQFGGPAHSESSALSTGLKTSCASMACAAAAGSQVLVGTPAPCSLL